MAGMSVPAVSCAATILILAGVTSANADKSLRPYGHGYKDQEAFDDRWRPEGVQIFVGTPRVYDGYSPYYGPYIYAPLGPGAGGPYVGPNYRGNDADCRRWAWAYKPWGKGRWRCAEW